MPSHINRLNAVIAALEKVRDHVDSIDGSEDVSASSYNRWIGTLDGVVEGNWQNLKIDEGNISASELLMHLDAAIAFLKECSET